MAVSWDKDLGRHRLDDQAAPGNLSAPVAVVDADRLPDGAVETTGRGRLWLQRRIDGTDWLYDAGGTLVGVLPESAEERPIRDRSCPSSHSYLAVGDPSCPVCKPLTPLAIDRGAEERARRHRTQFRLSYSVGVIVLAIVAFVGDSMYEDYSMSAVLDAAGAVESPEIWGDYQSVIECAPMPAEVGRTSEMRERALEIGQASSVLAEALDDRLPDLAQVRVAPWHREVELARDRLILHELAWIDFLREESEVMDAALGHAGVRLARVELLDPWSVIEAAYLDEIIGTFGAAHNAAVLADATTRADFASRIASIFDSGRDPDCGGTST